MIRRTFVIRYPSRYVVYVYVYVYVYAVAVRAFQYVSASRFSFAGHIYMSYEDVLVFL